MCTQKEDAKISKTTKSRITKLGNKSKEELINVILRKDDVEKKLQERISNYKENITYLENKHIEDAKKIESLEKNAKGTEQTYISLKEKLINSELRINDYQAREYKLVNTLNDIKQERKLSNIVAFISIIINILLFVYIFV